MARNEVDKAIRAAAERYGLAVNVLRAFAKIESGGNPNAQTGSYHGLFQMSKGEFGRFGRGDIYNPTDNANAAAAMLASHSADWQRRTGRSPSPAELYMIHQQGAGGARAHYENPSAPAWQNMLSTAEGRDRGERWAKQAIWGNIPEDRRARFGSVDNVTSRDFISLWTDKVSRFGGRVAGETPDTPAAPAQIASGPVKAPLGEWDNDALEAQPPPDTSTVAGMVGKGGPTTEPTPPRVTLGSLFGVSPTSEVGQGLSGIGKALSSVGKSLASSSKVSATLPAMPALPDQDDRAFALPPPIPRTPPGQAVADLTGRRRRGRA
jgi:hypothetical protein